MRVFEYENRVGSSPSVTNSADPAGRLGLTSVVLYFGSLRSPCKIFFMLRYYQDATPTEFRIRGDAMF